MELPGLEAGIGETFTLNQYVFRDTLLIFWTTDSLQPVADIPLRDMVARQNFVLGEVRQYLAMFGLDQGSGEAQP